MTSVTETSRSIHTPGYVGPLLLAAIVAQGVFASVYLGLLWHRGGYEPLPWIVGFSLLIGVVRYLQHRKTSWYWHPGPAAFFLTLFAAAANGLLLMFAGPWLLGAALVSLTMALEFSLRIESGARGLAGVSLPILALLMPVAGMDFHLNDLATQIATDWSNRVLNVGKVFHLFGEITLRQEDELRRLTLDYSINSWAGYPFLAAVALGFIGLNRRRLFHAAILLASTFFWVIFAKVAYISFQAFAFQYLNMDASTAEFEKWLTMGISLLAVGLVWSTDMFLAFWFGPVDPDNLDGMPEGVRSVGRFWNQCLASYREPGARTATRSTWNGYSAVTALAIATVVLGAIGFFRFRTIDVPAGAEIPVMAESDFSTEPAMEKQEFRAYSRQSASPSGQRQYSWIGYRDGLQYHFSLTESVGRSIDPRVELLNRSWELVGEKVPLPRSDETGDIANHELTSDSAEDSTDATTSQHYRRQLLTKRSGEEGILLYREVGREADVSSDLLGRFPKWSDPRMPEMFLTPRVYAKVFIHGYRPVDTPTLEWAASQTDRLVDRIKADQDR